MANKDEVLDYLEMIEDRLEENEEQGVRFESVQMSIGVFREVLEVMREEYRNLIERTVECPKCRQQFTTYFENGNKRTWEEEGNA